MKNHEYSNGSFSECTNALLQSPDPNERFNGFIPIEKLDITYSASSGPGGQNVNKVNYSIVCFLAPNKIKKIKIL